MKTVIDWRKLTHKHLEEIRKEAMFRVFEGWEKPLKVIKSYWLWSTSIYNWIKAYKTWWNRWLKSKKGKVWRKSGLSIKEQNQLVKMICKWPAKCMLDFGLWTIEIIQNLIITKFWVHLHSSSINRLLKRLWLSNQKPLYRAYQQDPTKVQKWLNEEYPAIKKEAMKEKREITRWDESWFKSTDHRWKTRWKKWETPVIKSTWARFSMNAVSCVSNKWTLRFMVFKWTFKADTLIQFLKTLIYKSDRKYTLILDWHPTHKAKKVKKFLESIDYQIKIYYLPWYSPELNPDELVWNEIDNKLKQRFCVSQSQLWDEIRKQLYALQKNTTKLIAMFWHKSLHYI